MLALYGHPFSSYTWKALIALYANGTPFEFRMVDPDHLENAEFVAAASPSSFATPKRFSSVPAGGAIAAMP